MLTILIIILTATKNYLFIYKYKTTMLLWIKVLLLLITFFNFYTNNHFANATKKPQIPQERGLYWKFEPFDNKINTTDVKEIHVVFSNHLDVGFNSRAWCDGGSLRKKYYNICGFVVFGCAIFVNFCL